jgi:hypothetical protein
LINKDIFKIAFLTNNNEECTNIQKMLFKYNFKWSMSETQMHYFDHPVILIINLNNIEITYIDDIDEEYKLKIKNGEKKHCYNILFDMNSIKIYENILKTKNLSSPTYLPKKPNERSLY